MGEHGAGFCVVGGGGHERDVHALDLLDLGVVDLLEDQVVADPQRVAAAAVEALRRHAAEVANARQRDGQQAIEEIPHAIAAQREDLGRALKELAGASEQANATLAEAAKHYPCMKRAWVEFLGEPPGAGADRVDPAPAA